MGLPPITLQPGGSRPPTSPQKANILAILGASAIGHGHSIVDIAGLVAVLGGKLGIHKSSTAPVDTSLLWFNTATDALAVYHTGSWRICGGAVTVSALPPAAPTDGAQWLDSTTGILSVWYVDAWIVPVGGGSGGDSVIVSAAPPASPTDGKQWFDTTTGILSIWYVNAWIATAPSYG